MRKFLFGIFLFLVQQGLSMFGIRNIYLGIGLLSIAGILIVGVSISTLRAVWKELPSSLSEATKTLGVIIITLVIMSAILTSIMAYKVSQWESPKLESKTQDIRTLSPKELELKLRESLDVLGYKTGSTYNPEAIFQFLATDVNGTIVNIAQRKSSPSLITILLKLELPQDLQQKIEKMKEKDRHRLIRELRMTIDRQGILRSPSFLPLTMIILEDSFLKDDLQNLSVFSQKIRTVFLTYYSVMDVISSFMEQ